VPAHLVGAAAAGSGDAALAIAMTETISMLCQWCEQPFRPRRGGSPQRFCGPKCRATFWAALRRLGERAFVSGIVTIDDIRNADPAAYTLSRRTISPGPVPETPKS
jgi:hypothetical protein